MKQILHALSDAALYLIVFCLLQILCAGLSMRVMGGDEALVAGYAVSAVLTILLFGWRRWAPLCQKTFIKTRPYPFLAWMAVLGAALVLPSAYLEETFVGADIPEDIMRMLQRIMASPMGYLVVGIIVPVAEETVFRGAILRRLLHVWRSPWVAIALSAILFGLVHGNVPQFCHAFLMGLLLGWTFRKTGSILPGIVIHWVNNSIAFVLYGLFPDNPDARVPDYFGGNEALMYSVLAFSAAIAILALWHVSDHFGMRDAGKAHG